MCVPTFLFFSLLSFFPAFSFLTCEKYRAIVEKKFPYLLNLTDYDLAHLGMRLLFGNATDLVEKRVSGWSCLAVSSCDLISVISSLFSSLC